MTALCALRIQAYRASALAMDRTQKATKAVMMEAAAKMVTKAETALA